MLFSASFSDLVVATWCLQDVSSGTRRYRCLKWPMFGAHLWIMQDSHIGVINPERWAPPTLKLLLRLWGLPVSPGPHLSLPVCTLPSESPVILQHCFEHFTYFAVALGQTEICWSSPHVLLFLNGSKLKKHWTFTALRGRKKICRVCHCQEKWH